MSWNVMNGTRILLDGKTLYVVQGPDQTRSSTSDLSAGVIVIIADPNFDVHDDRRVRQVAVRRECPVTTPPTPDTLHDRAGEKA